MCSFEVASLTIKNNLRIIYDSEPQKFRTIEAQQKLDIPTKSVQLLAFPNDAFLSRRRYGKMPLSAVLIVLRRC